MTNTEIETFYSHELRKNSSILWKEKIKLFPVTFDDIDEFSSAIECLIYDPMNYEDIRIATLPRLYFLTSIAEYEYTNNVDEFIKNKFRSALYMKFKLLLQMVLKEQEYDFVKKNKYWQIRLYSDNQKTDYVDVNSNDFEELRKLILLQNGCSYSDEFVHNDIKKYIQEENDADKNNIAITFEEKKEIVMLDLHIQDESIIDTMTIRRVNRICDKVLLRENYVMQTTASMSGMVTFKKQPTAWYGKSHENVYDKYFKQAK